MEVVIKISGMSCGHCRQAVHEALAGLPGVVSVDVSLEQETARIKTGPNFDRERAEQAVRDIGFEPTS